MQKTTLNDPKRTPRIAFPAMVILLLGSASMPAQTGERRVSSSNTSVFTSEPCKLDPTVALTDASVSLPSDCSPPDSLQRPPNLEHAPRTLHQGDLVSFTTLAAPKNAERAYEKARRNLTRKKPRVSTAARELTTAVALYPQFAAAWYLLGETRLALRQNEAAREAFLRALGADPKYPSPYAPLALMELEVGRFREAAEFAGLQLRFSILSRWRGRKSGMRRPKRIRNITSGPIRRSLCGQCPAAGKVTTSGEIIAALSPLSITWSWRHSRCIRSDWKT